MNTKSITYSPPEVAKLAIETLRDLQDNKDIGIKTLIPTLDAAMLPLRPAEMMVVMGYTSNYKSGFMNWMLKSAIAQSKENELCIKVTWEDSVEEDTVKWLASDANISVSSLIAGTNTNWEKVMHSYQNRINTPLWIVGHSNRESANESKARPRMTMTDVQTAIEYIRHEATDHKYNIKLIALDYLQRIRPDAGDGGNKREQMMEAVNKAKDLAISFGCAVMLGVQASRAVLDREFKLPRLDDGLETSNIEQSSDKVISLWYPIKTEPVGARIAAVDCDVSQNLLVCGLLKQKMGPAPVLLPLYVEPERNRIYSLEKRPLNP